MIAGYVHLRRYGGRGGVSGGQYCKLDVICIFDKAVGLAVSSRAIRFVFIWAFSTTIP